MSDAQYTWSSYLIFLEMFYTDGAAAVERHIFLSTRRWKGEEANRNTEKKTETKTNTKTRTKTKTKMVEGWGNVVYKDKHKKGEAVRRQISIQKERHREHHEEKMCKFTI